MNTMSHILLAEVVRKEIEISLRFRLNKKSFMYGNIKPDISFAFINNQHSFTNNYDLIKNEIEKIFFYSEDVSLPSVKELSVRLGQICHYLSDFFCYAHQSERKCHGIPHVAYEKRLHKYQKNISEVICGIDFLSDITKADNSELICDKIIKTYAQYKMENPSFGNDIFYSLRICIETLYSIISSIYTLKCPDELAV